ncbi:MAG: membrane protein insertase YidC [candidate division WOR-3 bacterium]|nr:MAG: membrane protein insertase YidC [candidate division WOR-3 bacterium]
MSRDTIRMIIGFGVIVVILIVWQLAFRPKPRPQQPLGVDTSARVAPDTLVKPEPVDKPEPKPALVLDTSVTETSTVLENDFVRYEFTNLGGALKSARLKRYDTDLVPQDLALFSTVLLTADSAIDLSGTALPTRSTRRSVTYSVAAEGLSFTKTFVLEEDYILRQEVEVSGAERYVIDGSSGMAVTEQNTKDDLTHFHFYARTEGKTHRFATKNLKEAKSFGTAADWVGLKSKYFFVAAIPPEQGFDSCRAIALEDQRIGFSAVVKPETRVTETVFYVGPLEYDRLRSFRLGFEEAVSLGFAKPVALGILWLLKLLYRVFRNWGVAIIIFAVLMKAVFFPLTRTQTKQMRQMQLLQPKLKELKKKYKNDPQTLNQETMQLYKLYKVNPLSGCLPMLVQLPVFWALYSVLRTFIDLRGARFVFWLKDLSQPDTLFGHLPFFGNPAIGLLPILMGVSFIAQNMLTQTDKKNWALTIIFPIFITVIFLNFPSGLQLYWFMYNVLSIVESIIGLRGGRSWLKKKPKKESPKATPPAKAQKK